MQSLKDICTAKLTSLIIQRKLPLNPIFDINDYIGVLPNELLSCWSSDIQTEMRTLRIKLLKTKLKESGREDGSFTGLKTNFRMNAYMLKRVKDAHELGICQEIFEAKCHLCGDEFCILCAENGRLGINNTPCTRCTVRKEKEFLQTQLRWASQDCMECNSGIFCFCKECCLKKAKESELRIEEHRRGECSCQNFPMYYPKCPFYPVTEDESRKTAFG